MTDKTIVKGIAELLGRKMLEYKKGNFRERVANVYGVLPEEGWLLDLSEEESLSIGKRLMAPQQEAEFAFQKEATSLSNGEYKKNKKKTNFLNEAGKVVRGPTTKLLPASSFPLPNGNNIERSNQINIRDLPFSDPVVRLKTRAFLNQVDEAFKAKKFLSQIPPLVNEYVTETGPSGIPLEQLLNQFIRPKLVGKKGDEFFVKLQTTVTRDYQEGLLKHQRANESNEARETRIRLATQRKLQRRVTDGAIELAPGEPHRAFVNEKGGSHEES